MSGKRPVNIHFVINEFRNDSRVLREIQTIDEMGMFEKVQVIAYWEEGLKEHEELGGSRAVWRVPLRSRTLKKNPVTLIAQYIEWICKSIWRLRKDDIKVIHCHDLPVLPIGFLLKLIKKSKLVYDAHELETEIFGLRGIRKAVSKLTEKLLVHRTDALIVVSDSIAEWYRKTYSLPDVTLLRNIPYSAIGEFNASFDLKNEIGIPHDAILFIYQGVLSVKRNIQTILDVFSTMPHDRHIVFMGFGPLEERVKEFARHYPNIHYQESVVPEKVLSYTRGADVGIHIIDNICLNHYYALPNKVFEYILSEIPIIVSDFPDMGKIIDEHDCGWKVRVDSESVGHLVSSIAMKEISQKKVKTISYKNLIVGWEKEEGKLKDIYKQLCEHE